MSWTFCVQSCGCPRGCSRDSTSSAWSMPVHTSASSLPVMGLCFQLTGGWAYLNEVRYGFSLTRLSPLALWSSVCVFPEGAEWDPLAYTRVIPGATLPLLQWLFPAEPPQDDMCTSAEIYVEIKWLNAGKAFCKVSEIQGAISQFVQHWPGDLKYI